MRSTPKRFQVTFMTAASVAWNSVVRFILVPENQIKISNIYWIGYCTKSIDYLSSWIWREPGRRRTSRSAAPWWTAWGRPPRPPAAAFACSAVDKWNHDSIYVATILKLSQSFWTKVHNFHRIPSLFAIGKDLGIGEAVLKLRKSSIMFHCMSTSQLAGINDVGKVEAVLKWIAKSTFQIGNDICEARN